jgi:hypothetical protein
MIQEKPSLSRSNAAAKRNSDHLNHQIKEVQNNVNLVNLFICVSTNHYRKRKSL